MGSVGAVEEQQVTDEANINTEGLERLENMEGLDLEYLTVKQRDAIPLSDYAWPDAPGRPKYPCDTQAHLDACAKLLGHAPDDKQASIKARAIRIAKRHKFTLPDSWKSDESKEATESAGAEPAMTTATLKPRIARIKVRWLCDDAISLNRRQYPREAVDRLIQSAQIALADPNHAPLTCYISHESADQDDTLKLVGRLSNVWREGPDALALIDVPDTHHGRDTATLAATKYINTMSLRASGAELTLDKNKGLPQVGGTGLTLLGVDFTNNPGIPEAKIQQVLLESADRAGICEVFALAPESLIVEKQEQSMENLKETVKEGSEIPPMASGLSQGMTSDPTDDAYHKKQYNDIPPMLSNAAPDGMRTALTEAHDHIAMVQGRDCAPGQESARGKAARKSMREAGKKLSGKNDKHLDAAHDGIAKALGMECEAAMNKKAAPPRPDSDGDYDGDDDDKDNDMESAKESTPMSKELAEQMLREAGYTIQRPKTEVELLLERMEQRIAEERQRLEEEAAARQKALEEQLASMQEKLTEAANTATPQRRSLVEGATVKETPQRPRIYKNGDYLREQLSETEWPKLADRSYPLPENIDIERLLEEMKAPFLKMFDDKYGLM